MSGDKGFFQFRPARGMTSSTFTLSAGVPGGITGLPLTDTTFGIFVGGEPAGSDYLIEQVIIYHDAASTGTLNIGGATSCVLPIIPGSYFPVAIDAISRVHLSNPSGNDATGAILLLTSEPIT